jgi:hypothetical protein
MNEQLELKVRARRDLPAPEEDVATLLAELQGRRWVIKSRLVIMLDWTERRVQAAKEASNGQIIASSQRGYCRAAEATREEHLAAIHEMRNRIRTMAGNYVKELRHFHSHQRAA